jgi:hypothetical protein
METNRQEKWIFSFVWWQYEIWVKGIFLFLQVTVLVWIYVASIVMQNCCSITPVLYPMASWVMLSGTVTSFAGWGPNDTSTLVITLRLCRSFHSILCNNLFFMYILSRLTLAVRFSSVVCYAQWSFDMKGNLNHCSLICVFFTCKAYSMSRVIVVAKKPGSRL